MTTERPMFPPRAESVDSFSLQPAIGQPDGQTLTSESRKPADGLSRRTLLGTVAALAAAPAAARAIDLPPLDEFERVIDDRGRTWFKAVDDTPDPAFALIAAHRAAEVTHIEVINAQDEAEAKFGVRSVEAWDARDRCGAMCDEINAIAWNLANTPPTTLAGVAAVLRFANEVEDAGGDWPYTDTIGREGWHYQLRATMAQAVENLITAGKAVRS